MRLCEICGGEVETFQSDNDEHAPGMPRYVDHEMVLPTGKKMACPASRKKLGHAEWRFR